MAPFRETRPSWLAFLVTTSAILALAALLGKLHGWIASLWLVPLIIVLWVLEPMILSIAIIALALTNAFLPYWFTVITSGVPGPATVLLIIAAVHIVRIEMHGRGTVRRMGNQLRKASGEEREWRAFFQQSPAALLVADGEGRIMMGNPAARKLLGCEDRPLEGQGLAPI